VAYEEVEDGLAALGDAPTARVVRYRGCYSKKKRRFDDGLHDPIIRGVPLFHCHRLSHEDEAMMAKSVFE
jgi:hypothetical protein